MDETIALDGVKRDVFDLLLEPVETLYNQRGYYGFSLAFPDSSSYGRVIVPVLKSRYSTLSDEDIVSISNVFFVFISGYLRSYAGRNRFGGINDFTKLEIFRAILANGVNGSLSLLERKILNGN